MYIYLYIYVYVYIYIYAHIFFICMYVRTYSICIIHVCLCREITIFLYLRYMRNRSVSLHPYGAEDLQILNPKSVFLILF